MAARRRLMVVGLKPCETWRLTKRSMSWKVISLTTEIAHGAGELVQVVGVVPPGASGGIAAAHPIDEVFDLG